MPSCTFFFLNGFEVFEGCVYSTWYYFLVLRITYVLPTYPYRSVRPPNQRFSTTIVDVMTSHAKPSIRQQILQVICVQYPCEHLLSVPSLLFSF